MKYIPLVAAALLLSSISVSAQTQSGTTDGTADTPAVSTQDANNPGAPVEGANSFTEDQARERMREAGYTDLKDLKLDDKGFWNATAMKDGAQVQVLLDYQGNVVAR